MAERKEERQDFYRLMVFNRTTDEKEHYNPKHWHDLLEITVCLTGASEVWIDGREFRNKPGGVFVISPRTMHMVHGIPPVSEDTGYCLQINLRLLYPVMPQLRDIVFLPECEEKTAVQIIRLIQDIERLCETDPASVDIPATVISLVVLLCEKTERSEREQEKAGKHYGDTDLYP